MDFVKIQKKWIEKWGDKGGFDAAKPDKYYVLEMFTYPSGANMHIGHWFNYAPSDTFARFKRMQGHNVFHPMGFDSFGLPAENYAIKNGVHPETSTNKNIEVITRQFKDIGAMYDWDYEVITSSPEYYKWTQWLFLEFFKRGLAYRSDAPVNFCPSCKTVLANEQVVDGECERCSSQVVSKRLEQWFIKITDYADQLLDGLDTLNWPEKTVTMQRNWIGKSQGVNIVFGCGERSIEVFTTRADTLMGVTYVVVAPEHPLVDVLTTKQQQKAVALYKEQTAKLNEIQRLSTVRKKTGVFSGSYCIHPVTKQQLPVWIGDYVLASYGTGAVMGVPAHDERDFEFAAKHNLPIVKVVVPENQQSCDDSAFTEYGTLVNSQMFDGLSSQQAIDKIAEYLSSQNLGGATTNYRLRDWLVSRQRYWGAPIPIIHCADCGLVAVPYSDLPVTLPHDVTFSAEGESPLARHQGFINTICPKCHKPAKRDPDTLDTFVDSAWYFLRYPDNKNANQAFDSSLINKMLPVDTYVGGSEHACKHLLYARFITKALKDMGYINFDEPFKTLIHQGLILGPDGNKMSKSKGNVINPDGYVNEYGADLFRLYMMFGFSFTEGGAWSDDGIKPLKKWVERIERLLERTNEDFSGIDSDDNDAELTFVCNNTIKSVTQDLECFGFNTAIARMMELTNALFKYQIASAASKKMYTETLKTLILLFAPFAPAISEELWSNFSANSVFDQPYPRYTEAALVKPKIEYAVQINSKVRHRIMLDSSLDEQQIKDAVLADTAVVNLLEGKQIKKVITVKGKLINFIV